MRWALLVLLLLPLAAGAQEEKPKPEAKEPPDPVKALPKCLRPGVEAVYDRAGGGERLAGTVTFATRPGKDAGTVEIELGYDSGDRGVLTLRDRLTAVLDAATRKVLSFTYSVRGEKDEEYLVASRLRMETDPKKKPGLVHERLTYGKKDEEPRVKRTRPKLTGNWVPDRLEPFLVPLLDVPEKGGVEVTLLDVLTGRVGRKPATWRTLGEGSMRVGEESVDCRILLRTRDGSRDSLYLRASDGLPLKAASAWLTLRPPKAPPSGKDSPREGTEDEK